MRATASVVERAREQPHLLGGVSADYLDLLGYAIYGWLWARMVAHAPDDAFGEAKRLTAAFYFERVLPRTTVLNKSIHSSGKALSAFPDEAF
ncbi:MAG: acyl-CoA dehydrogenase C-terminal domain-containing protein [Pseudomonadales bacterium]|nr:acyl-CoA dehydrogenase C-terminal domain-containing protein [Pseudomonadales bacterium]MDP6828316.1 acyl-CoA dehydrogenase C-terminal domain-containing protein [Pseudomonadales bacterium]MDP6972134.1 acyl-CoA dehydrogenase C-terminal domain-containing protein [Pseudomonadales bacterium]